MEYESFALHLPLHHRLRPQHHAADLPDALRRADELQVHDGVLLPDRLLPPRHRAHFSRRHLRLRPADGPLREGLHQLGGGRHQHLQGMDLQSQGVLPPQSDRAAQELRGEFGGLGELPMRLRLRGRARAHGAEGAAAGGQQGGQRQPTQCSGGVDGIPVQRGTRGEDIPWRSLGVSISYWYAIWFTVMSEFCLQIF